MRLSILQTASDYKVLESNSSVSISGRPQTTKIRSVGKIWIPNKEKEKNLKVVYWKSVKTLYTPKVPAPNNKINTNAKTIFDMIMNMETNSQGRIRVEWNDVDGRSNVGILNLIRALSTCNKIKYSLIKFNEKDNIAIIQFSDHSLLQINKPTGYATKKSLKLL